MTTVTNNIKKQLEKLTRRERIAVYVITAVIPLLIWDIAAFQPLSNKINTLEQEVSEINRQLADTDKQILGLEQKATADPDTESRALLAEYSSEKQRLDQELAKTAGLIINPQEMARLLEQILKSQTQLKFISLQNTPAVPQLLGPESLTGTDNSQGIVFRHSVILKMEGSYHDTLAYLHKLEKLPWHFSWKSIDIQTRDYPVMQITLEVYTFSLKRGLIGA